MSARRESECGVLGQETLMRSKGTELQMLVRMIQCQFELAAAAAVARAGGLGRQPEAHLPEQPAACQAKASAATDPHERLDRRALELRRGTPDEVADAQKRPMRLPL